MRGSILIILAISLLAPPAHAVPNHTLPQFEHLGPSAPTEPATPPATPQKKGK